MNVKAYSETELQKRCEVQLFSLGSNVARNDFRIEDVGDYIPGGVMVQDLTILTNTYMNQYGCDYLRKSSEELKALGPVYFDRFFPAEEMVVIKSELMRFVNERDENKVHSFFQRVKPDFSGEYSWHFTTSMIYPRSASNGSLTMIHISLPINALSYAGKRLAGIVEEDLFIRNNYCRFNLLTVREKEIVRLIAEGSSSSEIADMLFLSIHTVNNHRKNILHKLEINSLSQLIRFASAFRII